MDPSDNNLEFSDDANWIVTVGNPNERGFLAGVRLEQAPTGIAVEITVCQRGEGEYYDGYVHRTRECAVIDANLIISCRMLKEFYPEVDLGYASPLYQYLGELCPLCSGGRFPDQFSETAANVGPG